MRFLRDLLLLFLFWVTHSKMERTGTRSAKCNIPKNREREGLAHWMGNINRMMRNRPLGAEMLFIVIPIRTELVVFRADPLLHPPLLPLFNLQDIMVTTEEGIRTWERV